MFKASSLILAIALVGCATETLPPPDASGDNSMATPPANDFPTQERVEYVLTCIEKKGGLKYETLYPCICKIDKIAEKMRYDEYTQARTFNFMRSTPGEKGAIFRDPPQSKQLRKLLEEAENYAESSCYSK